MKSFVLSVHNRFPTTSTISKSPDQLFFLDHIPTPHAKYPHLGYGNVIIVESNPQTRIHEAKNIDTNVKYIIIITK
jgi:hypothetical protein